MSPSRCPYSEWLPHNRTRSRKRDMTFDISEHYFPVKRVILTLLTKTNEDGPDIDSFGEVIAQSNLLDLMDV